ncbi:MAG: DUF3368 domain-containing protein [Tepidisphaeraceae bacterium]
MIVVSDTTPLNYIVLIGAVAVLPKLFDDVYAPDAVVRELADARTPEPVRAWALRPPEWLTVLSPSSRLPSTSQLDAGEPDAISLAKEIKAPAVLLDEKLGRSVALSEGLVVIRTLALLELAAERELIELRPTLERLQATTFRVDRQLIDTALARDALRKRGGG